MSEISEASLLDYIRSSGGKVKNSDLSKTYKHFINHSDLQLRAKYREEFKLIIDRIAVVKSENGEKYLILKKKYRQEQVSGTKKGGESIKPLHPNPQNELLVSNPMQNRSQAAKTPQPVMVAWCSGPMITVTDAQEPTDIDDQTEGALSLKAEHQSEEISSSDREEELDKDSGSKSESEQDEESGGSLGSTSVALDPLEKEWIFSAASGKLCHLTQLLKQDSSLANKKDFTSGFTALHWAAKHGKEDMTTALVEAGADINTKAHGGYTPLHIAALHGHRHIVDLLVRTYGAKENLRDYSGRLPYYYLNLRDTHSEEHDLSEVSECHSLTPAGERRNRKISSLFQSMKRWGSAEELAPVPEERTVPHQLMLPAFRPRKFSR